MLPVSRRKYGNRTRVSTATMDCEVKRMALHFANDNIWIDKKRFDAAECQYYESLTKDFINSKSNKKCATNCNGNVNEVLATMVNDLPNVGKSKKGGSGSKNKVNQTVANTASVQQPEITPEIPVKPKKNKKKNKSQNASKNNLSTNAEAGKSVELPQTKNKKNPGQQAQKRGTSSNNHCTLVSEIAKAREHIKNSLEKMDGITTLSTAPASSEVFDRLAVVEKENAELRKLVANLKNLVLDSQNRIAALETQSGKSAAKNVEPKKSQAEDDDGVDLFASDSEEENEDAARIREERLAAYAAKKSKKPALIAKSSLVLDVKPWDDETDLNVMEAEIRKIVADGLLWGASKFVPVAFGIKKLSISCVVEDEKISIDWLTEEIEKLEDYVQSVDVAAFNKI